MIYRKITKKYYFSVEGETEQWYLKWLQDTINSSGTASCRVSIDCPVQKNPLKRAKSINNTGKVEIWHLSDYESNDEIHQKQFMETMDQMKAAKNLKKQVTYQFGYSNFTFDLWMILHMADCRQSFAHRKNYITPLNKAYGENFENMDEYKYETNFKRCLGKLSIQNVIHAIHRAKQIMEINKQNGYVLHQYKGYRYYKENPSLTVWEIVEQILTDCGLMQ